MPRVRVGLLMVLTMWGCSVGVSRPGGAGDGPSAPAGAIAPVQPVAAIAGTAESREQPSAASELNRLLMSLPPPPEGGDLPLGPGDLVEVSVFDVEELSKLRIRIPHSGHITLPLVGSIPAAGATALELENRIRTVLAERYMYDPQVSVFVHEQNSQRVSVIGAVQKGGIFPLTTRLRLADALALAGGLTDDASTTVYLIRRVPARTIAASGGASAAAGQVEPETQPVMTMIDLQSLGAGKHELNLPLQAGDVVEVVRAGTYYVGGEVRRPGSFLLKTRTTVDQAPVVAGGVTEVADWDDLRVYRLRPDGSREVMQFSINDFEAGKPGPELQPNDVVVVGKSGAKAVLHGILDLFRVGMSVPLI